MDRAWTASRSAPRELAGVWRVDRFCLTDSLHTPHEPFPRVAGYFTCTVDGHLSLQFGPASESGPLAPSVLAALPLSAEERPSYERGDVAYFGTYTVTSESTLVHHVEGGTIARICANLCKSVDDAFRTA